MRIATWNLWRPRKSEPLRSDALRRRLEEVDADIWILTETNDVVSPGDGYQSFSTNKISRIHSAGERRTTIWTRLPVVQRIPSHDIDSAVCVEVDAPIGRLLVCGTVIPYGGAGTTHAYRYGGCDVSGQKGWQLHYDSISRHEEHMKMLRSEYQDRMICLGGDFNQSRDGRKWPWGQWYGTKKGRRQLSEFLNAVGLVCVTEEDFMESGKLTTKSSVEHICLDLELAGDSVTVDAWEAGLLDGQRISDHNGVVVEIKENS